MERDGPGSAWWASKREVPVRPSCVERRERIIRVMVWAWSMKEKKQSSFARMEVVRSEDPLRNSRRENWKEQVSLDLRARMGYAVP